jgi:Carboxypeptidase regulatory-like domain/TonB dependent receptor-like, beta-barrel
MQNTQLPVSPRVWTCALWMLVLYAVFQNGAMAQSTSGDIVGSVSDQSGSSVANVLVTLVQEGTSFRRETHSDADGNYEFYILPPGTYLVSAEAPGFKHYANEHVTLDPRQVLRINIGLTLGNVSDQVTVVADSPVTNTENATVSESRDSRMLNSGPRGTVVMGTFGDNTAKYSLLVRSGGWEEASYKADGSHAREWQTSIDGNAAEVAYPGLAIPYQAIANENVTVVGASAEFRTPVTMDAVTKSGTNQLHGSYTFVQGHGDLNALPATNTSPRGPQTPNHSYNATASGPLYIPKLYDGRNKTFWLISFERTPPTDVIATQSQHGGALSVPTLDMRQGMFSQYYRATGKTSALIDPLSGQPFAGLAIPQSRWNSAAVKALALYYPTPNVASANPNIPYQNADSPWFSQGWVHQLFLRADQKVTNKNTLSFMFDERPSYNVVDEGTLYNSIPAGINGLTPSTQLATPKLFGLSDTHVFSPTIVNELRLGYFKQTQVRNADHEQAGAITSALGIDLGPNAGAYNSLRQTPDIAITGYQGLYSVYPQYNNKVQWFQLRDNLSIEFGRHSLKFGYDGRLKYADTSNASASTGAGNWSFSGKFSGDTFADFLLGLPQQTAIYTPSLPIAKMKYNELGLFAQDNFKASSKLTLNLGVRLDRLSPRTESRGAYYTFDPSNGAIVVPNQQSLSLVSSAFPSSVPIETAAQAGYPSKLRNASVGLSPRVGFAYRFDSTSSTVLRGGYSIFQVDSGWISSDYSTLQTGGPFAVTQTFVNSITNGTPLVTLDHPFPATTTSGGSSISVTGVNPNLGVPLVQQWTLSLERRIAGNWAARLSYVGSHTTQLAYERDLTRPPASTTPFSAGRDIYPNYQSALYIDKGANSSYEALQFGITHRFSSGLQLESLFQWQSEISDASEGGDGAIDNAYVNIPNPYCLTCERAKSSLLDSLDFRANFIYQLPFGKNRAIGSNLNPLVNGFVGGWTIAGSPDIRNGRRDTVIFSGVDTSNTNYFGGRVDVLPNCDIRSGNGISAPYLNIACFAIPANGTFGDANRSLFRKPGSWDVDGSIYKDFLLLKEKARLRISGVATNIANHPTWDAVGDNISTPASFGKLLTQGASGRGSGARVVTLQAQIEF